MKIGPLDNKPVAAPAAPERKSAGQPLPPEAEASAKVELSSTANALVAGDGSFDAAKVERIAQAIRDGKFQINPEAIADKLIANAQELLGRKSS